MGQRDATTSRPTFAPDAGFFRELKRRVAEHLAQRGGTGGAAMLLKTALLLGWFGASYALLVFVAATWWQVVLLALSLALSMAGIGFGVQHDANHGAYSKHRRLNALMSITLDMLGASSRLWRFKHNIVHHTYTNIGGTDDDIDLGLLARLCPSQRRLRVHRLQAYYLWFLYALLMPKWHFIYDFKNIVRARIGPCRFARPRGWALAQIMLGKAVFFAWAFALPMLYHPWWVVLLVYAATAFVLGVVLSVVFQLAHCVDAAAFPELSEDKNVEDAWAVHQVRTTVDFSQRSRLLSWYLGGLNFQIEHHLFPRVCHLHYPRIAQIVERTCNEFGVPYHAHETLFAAIASHFRWLRKMGRACPAP